MLDDSEREQQPWTPTEDDFLKRLLCLPHIDEFQGKASELWSNMEDCTKRHSGGTWSRTAAELERRSRQVMPAGWRPRGVQLEPIYSGDWSLERADEALDGPNTELEMNNRNPGVLAGDSCLDLTQ